VAALLACFHSKEIGLTYHIEKLSVLAGIRVSGTIAFSGAEVD
jgi:hypothetical protein